MISKKRQHRLDRLGPHRRTRRVIEVRTRGRHPSKFRNGTQHALLLSEWCDARLGTNWVANALERVGNQARPRRAESWISRTCGGPE